METNSDEAWRRLEKSELGITGVTAGTGFGRSVGLRISGKIFAMLNQGELILKLPSRRVGELIESGEGRPWRPGDRQSHEGVGSDPFDGCGALESLRR